MDQNLSKICRSSFRPPGPSLRKVSIKRADKSKLINTWQDTSCQRRRSQESKNISSAWGRVWCERSKQTWWGACIYLRTCLAKDLGRTSPWSRDMPQFNSLNLANNGNWKMRKMSCCEELSEDHHHLVPAADACLDIGETLLPTWNLDLDFIQFQNHSLPTLDLDFYPNTIPKSSPVYPESSAAGLRTSQSGPGCSTLPPSETVLIKHLYRVVFRCASISRTYSGRSVCGW